jgi:hypothetical protein
MNMQEKSDEVIHGYTRQQAIEDGVLVDVSSTPEAKEAGFKASFCLIRGVYSLVEVPAGFEGIAAKALLFLQLHGLVVARRLNITIDSADFTGA